MSDPSTPSAFIRVEHLVKRYGENLVLNGFELTVQRSETCVLIGGSGSGKSTFARLLIGLERPDEGEIWVDGVDLASLGQHDLEQARLKFAFVFQGHALLDAMTVFDNIAFPLREKRTLDAEEIKGRVERALAELELADDGLKMPSELSGGMIKRVGIARAVVTEPEILIYDEPTSGLDPLSARVVDDLIERMRTAHGVTSIVITHDMVTAYDIADSVALLADGKCVVQGPPEALFRSHQKELEAFTVASGMDLQRLGPRRSRAPAEKIRADWAVKHPAVPPEPHHESWLGGLLRA